MSGSTGKPISLSSTWSSSSNKRLRNRYKPKLLVIRALRYQLRIDRRTHRLHAINKGAYRWGKAGIENQF